jgi:hypothetical protein
MFCGVAVKILHGSVLVVFRNVGALWLARRHPLSPHEGFNAPVSVVLPDSVGVYEKAGLAVIAGTGRKKGPCGRICFLPLRPLKPRNQRSDAEAKD